MNNSIRKFISNLKILSNHIWPGQKNESAISSSSETLALKVVTKQSSIVNEKPDLVLISKK